MNIDRIREKYYSCKSEHASLLFFRVGEFYFTLFDDACFIGNLLGIEPLEMNEDGDVMVYMRLTEGRMYDMIEEIRGKAILPFTIFETEELNFNDDYDDK